MAITTPPSNGKTAITKIIEGDAVSPSKANAPHIDTEANLDDIWTWLDSLNGTLTNAGMGFDSLPDGTLVIATQEELDGIRKSGFYLCNFSANQGYMIHITGYARFGGAQLFINLNISDIKFRSLDSLNGWGAWTSLNGTVENVTNEATALAIALG